MYTDKRICVKIYRVMVKVASDIYHIFGVMGVMVNGAMCIAGDSDIIGANKCGEVKVSRTIKIAAVQINAEPAPVPERLARAEAIIAKAGNSGAQLVVLPEVFNTGYEYSDDNYQRVEPIDGPTVNWMKQIAARHNIHLASSLLLLDHEDIYNTLLLVAPDGQTWRYDKSYPWMWERAYFRAGHGITIADTSLGKLGLLICADVTRAELWARYAGKVDAMVICSCPPAVHELVFVFPDGYCQSSGDMGPLMQYAQRGAGETFGACLRRQASWLGVPVVNTTGAGTFKSCLPLPRLSLAIYVLARPDLWKYIPRASEVYVKAGYFQETYIADADGQVLDRVPPGSEDFALAEIALPESLPAPRGRQPRFGISALSYAFDDFANIVLASAYQRKVRDAYGGQMAPPIRSTRLWLGGLIVAAMIGYVLGRMLGRKR